MADLVVGLAKSAVEETLTMVKSAVEEDKKLRTSVKLDLMLISDELEMMRSFLIVAKEHATDDMERTLVRQVRNMALDVEDCIESITHLDNKSNWWLQLVPYCMPAAAPKVALDEAITALDLLKARVEALGQRNMRYNHIGDSSIKQPFIQMHHQPTIANATAHDILIEARSTTTKNNHCGLLDLMNKLINRKDGELQVVSLWGTTSNVGMASSVKEAYDHPAIITNFSCRAWVKLMHPFNALIFMRSLLIQFYTNCQHGSTVDTLKPLEMIEATEGGLIKEFMKEVSSKRYLVILEDMITMDDWGIIRAYLPDSKNGSCIVVQTQQLRIASMCIGNPYQVSELKRFSDDHSVCVFYKEDKGENVETTKQKAARVWLEKFQRVRVGREIDLNMFHRMAVQAAHREVIFVWGVAGVGKTSVVKHVYCTEVLQQPCRNFEKFGWVNVSHPFNLRDLSWSLLLDLHSESPQYCSMLRIKDPIQECRDLLHEHRCLVVIDGMESTEEWYLTKATWEIGHSRSRIIVITNEEKVAMRGAMQSNSIFNVKVLEVDEVIDLFEKKVHEKTRSPLVLTRESKLTILHKCGGLPKVIVAIADFLCGLGSEDWTTLTDRFIQELETNQLFGSLQGLFAWVHLYFRTCPDFLKPCIFYLSIFPVNHIIRRRRLVRRWIAEGYSRDTKESTAEENTEEFFSKLVKLSMIQLLGSTTATVLYKRMPLCQVNGFFREYIISRSMEENLVFSLEGRCCMNSQRTGRHLAIGRTWDRDKNVFGSMDLLGLRSLTVFGEWRSFFISDKMRLLRVLDLEDTSGVTNEDLIQIVKILPRLKFLSLRRCRMVSRLPNSFGDLRQLQSLDIRDTSIIRLPKSIISLQKLQYIRAGSSKPWDDDTSTVESLPAEAVTPSLSSLLMSRLVSCTRRRFAHSHNGGVVVSTGIGQLMALHTLGVIDVSITRGRAVLAELKNLTQVHKLGVSGVNQNNSHDFFSAISDHGHLQSLSVRLDEDNQSCLDCISSPPDSLQSFKLYGQVHTLPVWIKHLHNLRKLNLQMNTMLPQEVIDVLAYLPKLAILSLYFKVFPDGELQFGRCFCQLRLLEIGCDSGLQSVRFPTSGFPNLEALKLLCYGVTSLQFFGLEHLSELKEVWLSGSYVEAFKHHMQKALAGHPNEIKPVLRQVSHSS